MLSKRTWFVIITLGFLGSLAWGVENQFFNTFIYNNITPDPRPISWMVAASALTATLASIFMGALSDRLRHRWGRKPFLLLGYLAWGITTAVFPTAAFFQPIGLAIFLAISFDCAMTFFGSTANDSVFHAYVTDITTVENRGRVMGVLQILTWVALLIVYGGAGFIIAGVGYNAFFYIIGGLVFVLGLVASLLMQEKPAEGKIEGSYWSQIASTFQWQTLKRQKDLLQVLFAITLWGIAQQIFFPYLLIYLNHHLKIPALQSSILVFIAILVGGIGTAYPFGLLVDKIGRRKVALIMVIAEALGLLLFSISTSYPLLVITGILWVAPISGWTIATTTWVKDLFPEDKRAQFAGYVILFSVAFTMIPGPLLGSWISTTYGAPIVLDGQPGFVPPPLVFQAGGLATLLALLPLWRARETRSVVAKEK